MSVRLPLAVSNLAWAPREAREAYALLKAAGVAGIEVAPGLLFPGSQDPLCPTDDEIVEAIRPLDAAAIRIISMQALLFGAPDAGLFLGPKHRDQFRERMERAILLAGRLEIATLVFGSGRQRSIPSSMPEAKARSMAVETFRALGDHAAKVNAVLAVEAIPAAYGTNFLLDTFEAESFVAEVGHPAVRMVLDMGAVAYANHASRVQLAAARLAPRVQHIHISAPGLVAPVERLSETSAVCAALEAAGFGGWCSIEMRHHSQGGMPAVANTLRAVQAALVCQAA